MTIVRDETVLLYRVVADLPKHRIFSFPAVTDKFPTVSAVNHDKDFIASMHSDKVNHTIRNRWMRALELYIHNNYTVFIHMK